MSVIDFEDLKLLSGYKQPSRVIEWLKSNRICFVIGGDGKPRTTSDMLQKDLNDDRQDEVAEIRFG